MDLPQTPPNELSHSFNIKLTEEIIEKLKEEQEKLKNLGFVEQRSYDSSPHIAIATKFMSVEDTAAFVEMLKEEFKHEKVWQLEFSDFGISDTRDYIFLHVSKDSEQKLINFHDRVFRKTKAIGLEVQIAKKFRTFAYAPHISIIKLLPDEVERALNAIQKDFSGVTMLVTSLEITRQEDTEEGFSTFPVVVNIELQ